MFESAVVSGETKNCYVRRSIQGNCDEELSKSTVGELSADRLQADYRLGSITSPCSGKAPAFLAEASPLLAAERRWTREREAEIEPNYRQATDRLPTSTVL